VAHRLVEAQVAVETVQAVASRATVAGKFHGTVAQSKGIVERTDTVSTGIDYAALAFWVK
jgi:hypothetical protein